MIKINKKTYQSRSSNLCGKKGDGRGSCDGIAG